MNRGAQRKVLFEDDGDYAHFEGLLATAVPRFNIALWAYCLMPTHWHLLMRSPVDGGVSRFVQWLAGVHAQERNRLRDEVSRGAVYQGRFRAFAVQDDDHFVRVGRYVQRNALRAGLVTRAEDWPWGSLRAELAGPDARRPTLSAWPVERGSDWTERVNQPETEAELMSLRRCARRGTPYGDDAWRLRLGKLSGGSGNARGSDPGSDPATPVDAQDLDGAGAPGDAAG